MLADGIARLTIPEGEIFALTDGAGTFGPDVFPTVSDEARADLLARAGETEVRTEFNAYLLRLHGQPLTLVDTGCGTLFGPGCGRVPGLLAALGVQPGDIGRIIFTHLHRDHVGGAVYADGLAYPNAEIVLSQAEAEFWQGKDATAGEFLAQVAPRTVTDGQEIAPGVTAWMLPGHTPGHMGLRIGQVAFVGDILHSVAMQAAAPETCTKFDSDPQIAIASRRAALSLAAAQDLTVIGSHFLAPMKFAKASGQGDGYALVPVA